MTASEPTKRHYGLSTNVFIKQHEGEHVLLLGGTGQHAQPWAHTITQRAAHLLWFKLTTLLYPDKAPVVTALAVTAPLRPPGSDAVTTYVEVVKSADAHYSLVGWVGRDTWMFLLSDQDARQLWVALDTILYPVGWEGRQTKPKKLN